MRLLIVDDDYQIREGMKNGIEWETTGISEVETCGDGLEAMCAVADKLPDMIIADIQMPGMTGLEMIRRVREISSETKVIFISAYSTFDYCQQALRLGANDYVLKPIEMDEFMEVIRRNIYAWKQEKKKISQYKQMMIGEMAQKIYEKTDDADELSFYDMLPEQFPFMTTGYFITTLVRIECNEQLDEQFKKEQFKKEALEALCYHVRDKLGVVTEVEAGYVCLSPGNNSALATVYLQNHIKKLLLEWNQIYEEKYGSISAGISGSHGKNGFLQGYCQACETAERLFYQEKGTVLVFDPGRIQREFSAEEWEQIKDIAKKKAIKKDFLSEQILIDEFASQARRVSLTPQIFRKKLLAYYWELCRKYREMEEVDSLRSELENCQNARVCVEKLKGRLESQIWSHHQHLEQRKQYSHTTKLAIEFMERHYAEQITVVWVAQEMGKSPNYFSSLFKKETGCSFSQYLNGIRLDRAKWLLLQTNMQVAEIVEAVGYADYIYFSQLFRRRFSCSASEFRLKNDSDSE